VSISENDLCQALLRYIAGRSTESERAEFEERLLTDQEFSDDAAVCEQELIDAYALRQLNADDMEGLRAWIETSPYRRERVKMARALLAAQPRKIHIQRRIAFVLAAAACVALAVTLPLMKKMMQRDTASVSPTATTSPQVAQTENPPLAALPGTMKPDVILLAAERMRGEPQAATYQVHPNAPVQLQIMLPGETERSGYGLQVFPLEGPHHILLEKTNLQAESMNGQLYLNVALPPGYFPAAAYTASVSREGETLVSHFTLKYSEK
jgi:hypothetical protein